MKLSRRYLTILVFSLMCFTLGMDPQGGCNAPGEGIYRFTLSSSNLTVLQGGTVLDTIWGESNGVTNGSFYLAPAPPPGMSASFHGLVRPGNPQVEVIEIRVSNNVPPGRYYFTVTYRVLLRGPHYPPEASLIVDVIAPGSFIVTTSPNYLNMEKGRSDSVTINVNRSQGFTEPIALSEILDPSIVSKFIPDTTTSDSSILRLTVPMSAQTGQHQLRVRGRSVVTNQEKFADLTVNVLQGSSILSVSPNYVVSFDGHPPTATVTLNRTSCTDPVTLSGTPGGADFTFIPNPLSGNTTSSTLSLPSFATSTYRQTVHRIFGNPCNLTSSQTYFTVMDLPAETGGHFLLVPIQPRIYMNQGESVISDVYILRFGSFSQPIEFTAQGNISGVAVTFSPSPNPNDLTVMRYTASSNASGGTGTMIGSAPSNDSSRFSATVYVTTPSGVYFNIVPAGDVQVARGGSARMHVNLLRNNVNGPIGLSIFGLPLFGLTVSFTDPAPTGNQAEMIINAAQSLPPGQYILTVQGNYGGGFMLNFANFIVLVQ